MPSFWSERGPIVYTATRIHKIAGDFAFLNGAGVIVKKTSGAATQVTLPANPRTGRFAFVTDGKGDAATNNITVIGAASATINGQANFVLNTNYGSQNFMFNGTEWNLVPLIPTSTFGKLSTLKAPIENVTVTALGTVQNSTPTAAQIIGGFLTQTGVTGAGTVTLPIGTLISAAFTTTPAVGDLIMVPFASLTGQALTITGATGTTVIGLAAIPSGKNALLIFVNTGAGTWSVFTIVSA